MDSDATLGEILNEAMMMVLSPRLDLEMLMLLPVLGVAHLLPMQ